MIPLQLTIQGLYSYQEKQTIYFENLTEAGLFGIFGAVGSGKSSILEAISFALYGETERLNSRDKRAYNMMNLKSNKSALEFDFINYENKKYRVTREFKRNSKNFEDVKSQNSTFYEWKSEKWIPLDHLNTDEIVGLSYSNFKRTIIIPQGQFKEFIELGATDRTNMMKEIFDLHQFDLQNNTAILNAHNKSELDHLEGQLKGFEDINSDKIASQKEILRLEKEKFEPVKIEFEKIQTKYQKLKNLKSDFEGLKQKETAFDELEKMKENIDTLAEKTEKFDKIFRIFSPLILEKNRIDSESKIQLDEKTSQKKFLDKISAEHKLINDEIIVLEPLYKNLNDSKSKENDLSLILRNRILESENKKLQKRTEEGEKIVAEIEKNLKGIAIKIKELSDKNASEKLQKLDTHLLLHVGNWFSEKKKLQEAAEVQSKKITNIQLKIKEITQELEPFEVNFETFKNDFKGRIDILEQQKNASLERKNHLEVQQKLAHFSSELHDGVACPLCGSKDHPNIAEYENTEIALKEIEEKIEEFESQKLKIQTKENSIEKILERQSIFEDQLEVETTLLKEIRKQFKNHLNDFAWTEFNSEDELDFHQKRTQSFELEKEIEKNEKAISVEQKRIESERENFDKYNEILGEFKLKEKEVETQIKSNRSNLKSLNWEDFATKNSTEIEEEHLFLSKKNIETEERFLYLSAKEKELAPKLAAQKNTVVHLEKRISELKDQMSANEKLIYSSLLSNGFSRLNEVEIILKEEIDVQKSRSEIQKYRIAFTTLKNAIDELKIKLKDFSFSEEAYSLVENQYKNAEINLRLANDSVVKISSEIERLQTEYHKKEKLLLQLEKLQKRAENLKILLGLFKGAGFVQYVSSIYLRQLCDHANIRFHRMTRNQLSLQLSENGDFEIIDYLNEGRSRSVKTLSGGQSFQVSLSLALALAETVQAKTATEKNFFFIDEGFGTQDLESVNIVFETLRGLQKENRIVGIISHVEELKEKIPVSLQITKHEERGSLIEIL